MKTIRCYDLIVDILENDIYTTRQISDEFSVSIGEDFDLNNIFDLLVAKSGLDVCSFRYEEVV